MKTSFGTGSTRQKLPLRLCETSRYPRTNASGYTGSCISMDTSTTMASIITTATTTTQNTTGPTTTTAHTTSYRVSMSRCVLKIKNEASPPWTLCLSVIFWHTNEIRLYPIRRLVFSAIVKPVYRLMHAHAGEESTIRQQPEIQNSSGVGLRDEASILYLVDCGTVRDRVLEIAPR